MKKLGEILARTRGPAWAALALALLAVSTWLVLKVIGREGAAASRTLPEASVGASELDAHHQLVGVDSETGVRSTLPARVDRLVLVTSRDAPVVDARLVVGRFVPLPVIEFSSRTDVSGSCAFSVLGERLGEPRFVLAAAPGLRPGAEVVEELPAVLRIALEPGCSIRGRVLSNGTTDVEGLAVLCTESSRRSPSLEEVLAALSGDVPKDFTLAWTDPAGTFCIEGLEEGTSYDLIAGGRGVAVHPPRKGVRPSPETIELEAQFVHGSLIRLETDDGEPIRLSSAFDRDRLSSWFSSDQPGVRPIARNDLVFVLAAGSRPLGSSDGAHSQIVLYLSDSAAASIGPNRASYRIPGYAEREVTFYSNRVDDGIRSEAVVLRRICPGWGRIDVRAVGNEVPVESGCNTKPTRGALVLRGPEGRLDRYPMTLDPGMHETLDWIPRGRYRLHFENNRFLRVSPGGEFDQEHFVGEEALRLVFDLRGLSGIEFLVEDPGEALRAGGLTVALRKRAEPGGQVFETSDVLRVDGPPFCIPYLRPGHYAFKIVSPRSGAGTGATYSDVELVPGRVLQVASGP